MSDERETPPGEDEPFEVGESYDDAMRRRQLQRYVDTARRGVAVMCPAGVAQAQQLLEATFPVPTSIAIVCQVDETNVPAQPVRYVIEYGSGGLFRRSIALLPGVWYCGGDRIRVYAATDLCNLPLVARAFWYCCHAPHNIP